MPVSVATLLKVIDPGIMKQWLMVTTPDRPLTHINKKGRPVSQCTHCRGLRKSRAAHVKCDCGEKSHTKGECIFAERTDSKSELTCR